MGWRNKLNVTEDCSCLVGPGGPGGSSSRGTPGDVNCGIELLSVSSQAGFIFLCPLFVFSGIFEEKNLCSKKVSGMLLEIMMGV